MSDHGAADGRCDFCRQPIPDLPIEHTVDGVTYEVCSNACAEAIETDQYVFTGDHAHRHIHPEIVAFDASLPQGLPRNAFVLISGQPGTRDRAVHAELVWRTLQRDEPAVIVSFQEPPGSIVQQFLTLEWNVLPFLESGQLHIVDCFTYRVSNRERMFERMDEWNTHIYEITSESTTTIRDPSDLGELQNKLDNALEAAEMTADGAVLIDSLTELGTLVQPVQAYDFVKDLRADVCKGRFVPVFAGGTRSSEREAFPHDLGYVVDGLVDLRLTDELVANTLLKQVRIRKLSGVLVIPEWHTYEYTAGLGMVTFDPAEEQAETEASGGESGTAATDDDDDAAAGDEPA